uniref:Adrenomedullin 2 n=1 Tax=Poecilia reticulata TaxID=8081 RepID=A0A3P9NDH1_POERE
MLKGYIEYSPKSSILYFWSILSCLLKPLVLIFPLHCREPRINTASYPNTPPGVSDLSAASSNQIPQEDTQHTGRAPLHRDASSKLSDMLLHGNSNALPVEPVWQRGSRGRRHAKSGGSRGHGHLMRVGCVLGTCQVQNLSHRLYQLIGQNGREDFSPINPRSPHSYG